MKPKHLAIRLVLRLKANHLLSLSIIVTVALSLLATPLGSEDPSIMRWNVSDSSRILSSYIEILNVTLFFPEGIMTTYVPES